MIKHEEKEEVKDKAKQALIKAKEKEEIMFQKHKMCEVYDHDRKCFFTMKVSKAKELGIKKYKPIN